MSGSNKTKNGVSSARQAINERNGKIFEENFGFKKLKYPDKIFMKKIIIDNIKNFEQKEILNGDPITVDIREKNIIFHLMDFMKLL